MAYVTRGKSTAQTAVIYDALSEGPIEGLVDGAASIRLDKNPVIGANNSNTFSPQRSVDSGYTASTKIIVDNNSPSIFAYSLTTDGTREIQIVGAAKKGINAGDTIAGNNIIRTDTSIMTFASSDVYDSTVHQVPAYLRIDGAGPNGTQLATKITEFINTSAVRVDLAPAQTKSNTSLYLDLVDKVASYDAGNSRATLTTGGGIDTANTIAILSSPIKTSNEAPQYNYNNFGFAFRTGERDQPYLPTPAGIGSASQASSINASLDQVQNTGYPTNTAFGLDQPTTNATANEVIKTSAVMNVGNPSEVDAIKLNMAFPQGLIAQKENGTIGPGFAEHRIYFGYSRDGGTTYKDALVVGRPTIATSTTSYHRNTRTKDSQSGVITDKTKEAFSYTYFINTEEFQPYDAYRIKVQRLSPLNQKENKWQQTNASQLKSIENIITDKLRYPYTAYAGVVVDAEDFSKIPQRGYEIFGMKVKVPTNYFPRFEYTAAGVRRSVATYTRNVTTGADTGAYVDWDGNFRGDRLEFDNLTQTADQVNYEPVFTDNPIWIFMDMLTNPRYGLGNYLDPEGNLAQIDKWTMFQIAKYCDELVPDGKGGSEPRFTCNTYIAKNQDALKTLKQFATVIRSMLIWYNGQVTLGSNIQKGAVYTFNKSNVIEGQFNYSGTAGRFKHNQVRVVWNDPEDSYAQATEVVEDIDEIQKAGRITRKTVTAFGCTSQGQAHRYGKWHLFTERLEKEVVSFKTGINAGAVLRPGDIINVQDADERNTQLSGRITTASNSTTTVIKTDRDLSSTLDSNNSYDLHLIYPSGGAYLTQQTATINSVVYREGDLVLVDESGGAIDNEEKARNVKDDAGALVQIHYSEDVRVETQPVSSFNSTSITVSSAFSSVPNGEVIYAISGETDKGVEVTGNMKQYIITSLKENSDEMTFDINAAEYNVKKFNAVDRGYEIPELPAELRKPKRSEEVPVPQNLTAAIIPSGGDNTTLDAGVSGYDILLSWTHPTSTRTDSDGNTLTDVYEHLAGYRIQHNAQTESHDPNHDEFVKIDVDKQVSYTIRNVVVGDEYILRVQTRNTSGQTSSYIQTKVDFDVSSLAPFSADIIPAGLNGSIVRGGLLTATQNINTSNGTITFSNNTYSYQPLNGAEGLAFASANTNFTTQAGFNNLANGETGYLLFDYDGALDRGTTRSDPLQAIHLHTDEDAADVNGNKILYTFMKRLGESNNDIVQATGTIALPAGSSTITGTSTAFTTDFRAGDVVIVDVAGATRFYSTVSYIESDTSMNISSAPSRAYSGKNIFRQALRIDSSSDAVIAKVANNAGTFAITSFTNKVKIDNDDEVGANAIGSVQIAGNSIGGVQIAANSISAVAIVSNAIGSSEISANSIGEANIIAGAIGSSEIAANAIGAVNISANAIGTSEIAANSIGGIAIATNAIGSSEISANSIGTVAITANSITAAQLTSDAVGAFTVTANSITGVELASNSVGSIQIGANTINNAEISANSVTSASIAANSVNGTILLGNSVGSSEIAINSVNGIIIQNGAVDTDQVAGNAITTVGVAANAIVNASVASNAINVDSIAANSIENAQLKSNSVTAAIIQANAIGNSEIAANSVNAVVIAANAIESNQLKANSVNAIVIAANSIENNQIAINSVTSLVIQNDSVNGDHVQANSITAAKIVANSITNAEISATGAIDIAKISIGTGSIDIAKIAIGTGDIGIAKIAIGTGSIDIAKIAIGTGDIDIAKIAIGTGSIDIAKIAIGTGSIDIAKIAIGTGSIDFAKISVGNGDITNAMIAANAINSAKISACSINTAEINSNAITNAKISSTDSMTLTVGGGSAGGWALTGTTFASTNASGAANATFASAGITLGSAGFISAKEFYIDTSGNAKFKGTLEGDDVTVNGTLTTANITLNSTGANTTGTTIGTFYENDYNYRLIGTVGTGAGYYVGNIVISGIGGISHVKSMHFHVSDNSSFVTTVGTQDQNVVQQGESNPFSTRLVRNIDGYVHESRIFASEVSSNNPDQSSRTQGSIPVSFKYPGTGTVKLYIYAQGDNNSSRLGFVRYNFVKFGTTDPLFSFTNITGAALSTTYYANSQVTGGFTGTKTVSSSAQYSIDGGSFVTGNSQIANGSYINIAHTSSGSNLTLSQVSATIGGFEETFQVTTGGTSGGGGGGGSGGGGGGGCLVYGSNIRMADGTTKKVQDIAVGDSLQAVTDTTLDESNEDAYKTWTATSLVNASKTTSVVKAIGVDSYTWFYRINETLHATYEHPFLILRGETYMWKTAEDIILGDFLVTDNLVLEKVWRKQRVDEEVQTYNIDVEDADTYITENYVTHNALAIKE